MGCSVPATQVWLQRLWSPFQTLQINRPVQNFYHDNSDVDGGANEDDDNDDIDDNDKDADDE